MSKPVDLALIRRDLNHPDEKPYGWVGTVERMADEIEALRAMLRVCEWGGRANALEICPACGHHLRMGHDSICKLAKLIGDSR